MSILSDRFDTRSGGADAVRGAARVSAASEGLPTAAGHDGSIPRTFLAIADVGVLATALVLSFLVAPLIQRLLLSEPFGQSLSAWGVLPEGFTSGAFPAVSDVIWVLGVTAPATVLFMELLGGYRQLVDQSRTSLVASAVMAPILALALVALALVALKSSSTSRVFLFTFGALGAVGLAAYRVTLRAYKVRRFADGVYAKNVVMIGHRSTIAWMIEHFRVNVPPHRYQLAGWLSADPAGRGGTGGAGDAGDARDARDARDDRRDALPGLACIGAVEDLGSLLVHRPVHEVIAVQSAADRDWLQKVIEECDYFRVALRIVPAALLVGELRDLRFAFRSEPLRLPEILLAPRHLETDALFLKRLFDVIVSTLLLLLLSPLLLAIAIAIKITTPHLSVLYPWRVIGLKGRPFTGYKFTTMVADAEAKRDLLEASNEMRGPVFKVRDDPRVTPLGRILRKFSLNELPQLWSVLKGDMSLVGPRPAFRHELDRYELWHKRKLCVKPGITCLWQVSGRNRINDFDDWVRLDLQYIDEWSLWLDVRILLRTIWAVLAGTGV